VETAYGNGWHASSGFVGPVPELLSAPKVFTAFQRNNT